MQAGSDPEEPGRFLRPEATVLPSSAVIPDRNLLRPPPNQFTHEVIRDEPFYYGEAASGETPEGELQAGSRVALLVQDEKGERCRVADGRGLYVEIGCASLRRL